MATFIPPDDRPMAQLTRVTDQLMAFFVDASVFEDVRHSMLPLITEYSELLNLTHGLARAMLVFVLCHEIAHIEAGHLHEPASRDRELAADQAAAGLFLEVIQVGERAHATHIFIDPKIACAPLLLTAFLDLLEAWHQARFGAAPSQTNHPAAADRLAVLEPVLSPHFNDTAVNVLEGFRAGILDLKTGLMD